MEKKITTVYVPTEKDSLVEVVINVFNETENDNPTTWAKNTLCKAKPTKAYLYTPKEHEAAQDVQGYRVALEKIANNPIPSNANDLYESFTEIVRIAQAALSKAE